jgi:hypothetical protein
MRLHRRDNRERGRCFHARRPESRPGPRYSLRPQPAIVIPLHGQATFGETKHEGLCARRSAFGARGAAYLGGNRLSVHERLSAIALQLQLLPVEMLLPGADVHGAEARRAPGCEPVLRAAAIGRRVQPRLAGPATALHRTMTLALRKTTAALVLAALWFAPYAAGADQPDQDLGTANLVYSTCSRQDPFSKGFCAGYMSSIYDRIARTNRQIARCGPKHLSAPQLGDLVVNFLKDHPALLHGEAEAATVAAMQEAWCQNGR